MTTGEHVPESTSVAVVGGGYMGGGMAQTFAAHGVLTVLVDADHALSVARVARLHAEAGEFVERGLVPASWAENVRSHLRAADSLAAAVDDATYIAEAVPEQRDLKHAVLREISSAARESAIIATNTSAMPISGLAEMVSRPERFLGVHWMNPAPFVPCVEVVPSSHTSQGVVDSAVDLVRGVGKTPTLVADAPGFVASRLQYALLLESLRIVEEGVADVARVDEIVRNSFGFRLPFFGPIAAADIAGLDLYLNAFATMERAFGERFAPPQLLVEQVRSGRLGLKSGSGFYHFGEGVGADVARYRDSAFAGLGAMRAHLPPEPLTGTGTSGDSSP